MEEEEGHKFQGKSLSIPGILKNSDKIRTIPLSAKKVNLKIFLMLFKTHKCISYVKILKYIVKYTNGGQWFKTPCPQTRGHRCDPWLRN